MEFKRIGLPVDREISEAEHPCLPVTQRKDTALRTSVDNLEQYLLRISMLYDNIIVARFKQ